MTTYFTPKALTFFRQLAKNNDRTWFTPRKSLFEELLRTPMLKLIEELGEALHPFASNHVGDAKKALYRIHRDTRFSKDKTPYKTHIAAMFAAKGLGKNNAAGFYFHISHTGVEIAGGMYMPGPIELAAVRKAISEQPATFIKLVESKAMHKQLGALMGAKYARLPKGIEAHHPAAEYLRMKQWYFDVPMDSKLACSPTLKKEIITRFKLMAPAIHFLNNAVLAAIKDNEPGDGVPQRPEPMF